MTPSVTHPLRGPTSILIAEGCDKKEILERIDHVARTCGIGKKETKKYIAELIGEKNRISAEVSV
jgi:hypothetical protein